METRQDCLARLRRENIALAARIQALQQPTADPFQKLYLPYYEGLVRTNTEVIAILEGYPQIEENERARPRGRRAEG